MIILTVFIITSSPHVTTPHLLALHFTAPTIASPHLLLRLRPPQDNEGTGWRDLASPRIKYYLDQVRRGENAPRPLHARGAPSS